MKNITTNSTGPTNSSSTTIPVPYTPPTCVIDSDILNKKTLPEMDDIALSFFASACGKNRGAFVLDPPDGHTYSCLNLPESITDVGGVTDDVQITKAEDIAAQYQDGNITATQTIQMLDFLVQSVYDATPSKESNLYACEFNGLAKLDCTSPTYDLFKTTDGLPIRSVTLAGLFVPALWATGGKPLSLEQAKGWYTPKDFTEMAKMGLNTVQIPIPTAVFGPGGEEMNNLLLDVLTNVQTAGMKAVLYLVGTGDELDAVVAAAAFAMEHQPVVMAVTLPKEMALDTQSVVNAMRVKASKLPLFVPMTEGDLIKLADGMHYGPNVYGSLELSHSADIAHIASSTSEEDRSKLFYQEATSCMARSPFEFASCFQQMPLFLSSGFDLSIDDCIFQGISGNKLFKNYGQCDRFNETISSQWWFRHRQSFAARQLYAYERGLGWSFAAWKVHDDAEDITTTTKDSMIDTPAKLLALKSVLAAGLFPDLVGETTQDLGLACLNPPVADFVLGDKTLAPTMGPPPDCGDGWWNATTFQCDFWVPPPPCPVCDECNTWSVGGSSASTGSLVGVGLVGVVVGMVLGVGVYKAFFDNKRKEYEPIPN